MADGEHSVSICASPHGTRIVLGHESISHARETHEHYGLVCVMVGTGGGDHPDHEMFFAQTDGVMESKKGMDAADNEAAEHLVLHGDPTVKCHRSVRVVSLSSALSKTTWVDWRVPLPLESGWELSSC